MTAEHRKAEILNQIFQRDMADLVANLAKVSEERDALKAELEALKAKQATPAN